MAAKASSAVVLAARARRAGASVRFQWKDKEVTSKIRMTMGQRVSTATAYLLTQVKRNISEAVTVGKGPRGGRVVTDRSVPGEFPHAEYAQLLRTTFSDVREERGVTEGYVGTPLDYGLILETRMDRSFLVRTLNEEREAIESILNGPIK